MPTGSSATCRELLRPGDLLVFNDTRVVAARLFGVKDIRRASVELLLERPLDGRRRWCTLRASKATAPELSIARAAAASCSVVEKRGDLWAVELPEPALDFFERMAQMPLPPYIRREPDAADRERYQSIFARAPGAVAAPTASLHFDERAARALEARGVQRAFVTLHVGAGTFQPRAHR